MSVLCKDCNAVIDGIPRYLSGYGGMKCRDCVAKEAPVVLPPTRAGRSKFQSTSGARAMNAARRLDRAVDNVVGRKSGDLAC